MAGLLQTESSVAEDQEAALPPQEAVGASTEIMNRLHTIASMRTLETS